MEYPIIDLLSNELVDSYYDLKSFLYSQNFRRKESRGTLELSQGKITPVKGTQSRPTITEDYTMLLQLFNAFVANWKMATINSKRLISQEHSEYADRIIAILTNPQQYVLDQNNTSADKKYIIQNYCHYVILKLIANLEIIWERKICLLELPVYNTAEIIHNASPTSTPLKGSQPGRQYSPTPSSSKSYF